MKESEIDQLIDANDKDILNFYLLELVSKSRTISKENNRLGLIFILLIFLFYLIDYSKVDSLNVGPITIKDLTSIRTFIPLVFSFVILRYKVINSHKAELTRIIKKFSFRHFNFDNRNVDVAFTDDFTRTLLPISLFEEFNKFNFKGGSKIGCIGAVFVFPISIIITGTPYVLEFIWLKNLIGTFSTLNIYEKASTVLTIWVLVMSIYYFIQTMLLSIKESE